MTKTTVMVWRNRLGRGVSLRSKLLGILAGGSVIVVIAAAVLILVARQSDHLLERASTAQKHLELLMLLSARISDYGRVAMWTAMWDRKKKKGKGKSFNERQLSTRLNDVENTFGDIDDVIANQAILKSADDAQITVVKEDLQSARMKARFGVMGRQIRNLLEEESDPEERIRLVQNAMNVFGVHFAPQLARTMENQRTEVRKARREMADLRRDVIVFAAALALAAIIASGLLYWFAGRPILVRISQTVEGAMRISSGDLGRRLEPAGHDELALLMVRFNRMADSFTRREGRLLTMQNELQNVIDKRTAALSTTNARLEEIDAHRRRFFADISHELRTPLTVIIGETEVSLRQRELVESELRKTLEIVNGRANLLKRHVDDMLRVARSESGRLDLDLGRNDINPIIHSAIEDIRSVGDSHGIRLATRLREEALFVECDRNWMRQAIGGLLGNAIKHSPTDTQVTVASEKEGDDVMVSVRDQGYGISSADLPHIFDRFYKGKDDTSQCAVGFGIGLSLIDWIVQEHGGTIQAESPPPEPAAHRENGDRGSKFTLKLPLTRSDPL